MMTVPPNSRYYRRCIIGNRLSPRPVVPRLGLQIIGLLLCILGLSLASCSSSGGSLAGQLAGGAAHPSKTSLAVSVTFGPDGRLWRLRSDERHAYVDWSNDLAQTFSTPVTVNRSAQKLRAFVEDRPSIGVDSKGRVYVTYFADAPLPLSTYFSTSNDAGQSFSQPILVSDQAQYAKHYQDILAIAPNDRAYVFWSDEREHGNGNALYAAYTDAPGASALSNRKLADGLCECCRIAVDFDNTGAATVLARFIFPGEIRDHAILTLATDGTNTAPSRVTDDEWSIQACPEHGPALSISDAGRYHMVWYTQGRRRQGLHYAYSDDPGGRFSSPAAFGDNDAAAGHADIIAIGERIAIAWQEYDGRHTQIRFMRSADAGATWSTAQSLAQSATASDYPFLLQHGGRVYLSWNAQDHGYRLIPVPP